MCAYIQFFLQYERNRGIVSQLTVRIIFKKTHFLYPFTYWLTCRLVQFLSVIKGVSINMDVQYGKGGQRHEEGGICLQTPYENNNPWVNFKN